MFDAWKRIAKRNKKLENETEKNMKSKIIKLMNNEETKLTDNLYK